MGSVQETKYLFRFLSYLLIFHSSAAAPSSAFLHYENSSTIAQKKPCLACLKPISLFFNEKTRLTSPVYTSIVSVRQ